MSSSNLVRVALIEEAVLGETPVAGDFATARFTSESLSGTPETTQSQQIRTDRLASGQIVTSLTVEGELNFELAKEPVIDNLIESAMLNDWNVQAIVTVDLSVNSATNQITRASGSFSGLIVVGDFITLAGFLNVENNVIVQVIEVVSATVIKVASDSPLVTEVGVGTTYKRADKTTIGTNKKSFSMEKSFLDLTTKGIIYKGMLANTMNLNVAYGEIITGSFGFNGTKYQEADTAGEFITNARTITDPATSNSMNGSIDMPLLTSSAVGVLEQANFCIQSVSLSLNNNYLAQTCIGEAAPKDYSPGTAEIEVNMSTYLSDINWSILGKKLTQEPFSLGFLVKNIDGFYGFFLPAIQVSFSDPASSGPNAEISLDMSGVARVGLNGESSLTIYRS
jgi:Phage tail tube protein